MPDTPRAHRVSTESCCKRIRVEFNGEIIADTTCALYLFEPPIPPVYYIPLDDVRGEFLHRTEHSTHCPFKGDAIYWSVKVGDRVAENAVWSYPDPIDKVPELAGHAAFYWDRMDRWLEEDEEVFVHARDPRVRIDALPSSRHVQVSLDGIMLADTRRAVFLFETGLPTRYYIPAEDVNLGLLEPSERETQCPYKGSALYHHVRLGETLHENLVWHYPEPVREAEPLRGRYAFFNEKVDTAIDGKAEPRPTTKWSK